MFNNHDLGHVFGLICVNRARTSKRTPLSDSAHRIGVSTLSMDVLTLDQGVRGWMFKNRDLGHIFGHISVSRARTSKRIPPSDSAHRIGVSTLSMDVLTVDEAPRRWGLKNYKIGHVF